MQPLFVIAALVGGIPGNIPERPTWRTDYLEARTIQSGKPLAVFLGAGAKGYEKVVRDGLDANAVKLLNEKYVCVFIDTETAKGKALATAFAVKGPGLVISDRTGESQQFHHNGDLSGADLHKALERYADPNRGFFSTETLAQLNPPPAPVYQQPTYRYPNSYYTPTYRIGGS
jgi:hypothetical protein